MPSDTKENSKTVNALQGLIKTTRTPDKNALINIGIDPNLKSQEFRNIRVTSDFWNGIQLSIVNEQNDLNGKPIIDNKKLLSKVKTLFENGKKRINFSDLHELNIWTPSKQIVLGNLKLRNYSDILFTYDYYEIEQIDANKNIDNLWNDNSIDFEKILDALHQFNLSEKGIIEMKELDLNKALELHLKKYFINVKKGGTSNQGLIDLILGSNHNYGIELKMSKELRKAGNFQKALGQLELYTKQFKGNFLLIIAGNQLDKNHNNINELALKAKSLKANYYYLDTE